MSDKMAQKQSVSKLEKSFYTIAEFIDTFGERYGINSAEYLQKCCLQKTITLPTGGKFTHQLPDGWAAEKLAGSGRGIWILRKTNPENIL